MNRQRTCTPVGRDSGGLVVSGSHLSVVCGRAFQNEMGSFRWQRSGSRRAHGSPESFDFGGSADGAVLAIPVRMKNRTATSRVGALRSLMPRRARIGGGVAGRIGIRAGYPADRNATRAVDRGVSTKVCRGSSRCEARHQLLWRLSSRFRASSGPSSLVAVFVRLLVAFFEWRRRFVHVSEDGSSRWAQRRYGSGRASWVTSTGAE